LFKVLLEDENKKNVNTVISNANWDLCAKTFTLCGNLY